MPLIWRILLPTIFLVMAAISYSTMPALLVSNSPPEKKSPAVPREKPAPPRIDTEGTARPPRPADNFNDPRDFQGGGAASSPRKRR